MNVDDIAEKVDADVDVERDASGREGVARFTVSCDEDDRERVREQLAKVEADVAFETFQ